MKNKIINISQAFDISQRIHLDNKVIVLIGGCFDILHIGHVQFMEEAKKLGDILMLLLESDEAIRQLKGINRPINNQSDRSMILSSLVFTDYIIPLSHLLNDKEYDQLIFELKPDIIATTANDPGRIHKKRQAESLGIKLVDVIKRIDNQSTSKIAQLLNNEF